MKRENLEKLLLHKYPHEKKLILEKMSNLPDEVPNSHEYMNEFRNMDERLTYNPHQYHRVVFK